MKFSFKIDPRTRHASMSVIISIMALIGLIVVNLLFSEFKLRFDLTGDKLFSLRPETTRLLEGLQSEVEILALYVPGKEPENIMQVVNEYPKKTSNVKVKVLDPDRNPALIAGFGEEIQPGSLIVKSGDRNRVITSLELYEVSYSPQGQPQIIGQRIEQQISSAIAFVSSEKLPTIYEITGHRETTLGSMGYSETLLRANYKVDELSLSISDIPEDASLLTLIGPDFDISPPELDKLRTYLEDGGKILIAIDISVKESFDNLSTLLAENGINLLRGIVLEKEGSRLVGEFSDNPVIFAPYVSNHESVSSIVEDDLTPIFQEAVGFQRAEVEELDITYTPLLYTSDSALLRTDLTSPDSQSIDKIPGDEDGPLDMVSLSVNSQGSALIAMASAKTLAGLPFFGQIRANAELVTGLIEWSIDDPATVNIGSKTLFRDPLTISRNTSLFYAALATVVLPLICIVSGIILLRKRRNK